MPRLFFDIIIERVRICNVEVRRYHRSGVGSEEGSWLFEGVAWVGGVRGRGGRPPGGQAELTGHIAAVIVENYSTETVEIQYERA